MQKQPISVFHVVCAALVVLAVAMIFTASDLGPFGPLFGASALYIAIFAIIAQGFYWGAVGMRRFATRRQK